MKTLKLIVLICLTTFCFALNALAQKQGYNWYFGNNAGMDFNSGAPVGLSNSSMATLEGCSSISDANGNLLFYSDGQTVYNRLHVAMPNGTGLTGGSSSTQSALIVPIPGTTSQYYLFTVPEASGTAGFKYSIVDMSLAGGNGDVINKNTSVLLNVCEKLAGTLHSNGIDTWVTVHTFGNNSFYTYLVTASGISAPVISNVGTTYSGNDYIGYLKFSPNGDKAVSALPDGGRMDILDFDKSTGIFSNPITYVSPLGNSYFSYGAEFSSTGKTLYLINDNSPSDIYQFNMMAGSPVAILASATLIHTINTSGGALQLGPDGKMYYTMYTFNTIGAINYPDSLGLACNPDDNAVLLPTGTSQIGLPNMISNYFSSSFTFTNTCFGDTTIFNFANSNNFLGVQWDFGDPASGSNNVSFNTNPLHYFTAPDTFTVTAVVYYISFTDTITQQVIINAQPVVSLGPDTTICTGNTYLIDAGSGFTSYLWQDGSTNSAYTATLPGTYIITVSNGSCSATDSMVLTLNPCSVPVISFSSTDTSFCEKKCIDFFDLSTNNPTSWQWSFPGSDSLTSTQQNPVGICYNSYGSFDVTLIACNSNGCDTLILTGFINEYQIPLPVVTQSNDTLYSSPGVTYQWWNVSTGIIAGATNNYYLPTTSGDYYVIITDSIGCAGSSNVITVSFTGIYQLANGKEEFEVFPNPFTHQIDISIQKQNLKSATLEIKNLLGQTIYHEQEKLPGNSFNKTLDLSFLQNGIYFLELNLDGERTVKKIVKR